MHEYNKEYHFDDDLRLEERIGKYGRSGETPIAVVQLEADHVCTHYQDHHTKLEVEVELDEGAAGEDGNVEHQLMKLEVVEGCLGEVHAIAPVDEVLTIAIQIVHRPQAICQVRDSERVKDVGAR